MIYIATVCVCVGIYVDHKFLGGLDGGGGSKRFKIKI